MRIGKTGRIVAVTLFAMGSMIGVSSAAQAAPPGYPETCYAGPDGSRSGWAECYGGLGSFRAKVRCDKSWAPDYDRYGSWVYVTPNRGPRSTATCNSGDSAFNETFQTRHVLES
jgi:hypothetical protein